MRPVVSYPEIVGRVLKELRNKSGLDQATLANAVGVGQSTWSRIENGTIPITTEQLAFAAQTLKATPMRIMEYAEQAAERFRSQGIEVVPQRPTPSAIEQGLAFLGAAAIIAVIVALIRGGK